MSRRGIVTVACGLVLGLVPVSTAGATLVRVTPGAPTLATPIHVSWPATRAGSYDVTITVRPAAPDLACSGYAITTWRRIKAGSRLSVTLRPEERPKEPRKWCPGSAKVAIRRAVGDSGSRPPVIVATRTIKIRQGPRDLPPGPTRTPAAIRLLAGSTITVAAADHPARSAPVNGVLRGYIPSPFRLNDDIAIKDLQGSLVPAGLAADPLCPGASPPFSVSVRPSTIALSKTGRVTTILTLAGSPSQLSGCGPAGAAAGTTTIPLSGQTGPRGLLALDLDGSAAGIFLHLLVLVDLRSHA